MGFGQPYNMRRVYSLNRTYTVYGPYLQAVLETRVWFFATALFLHFLVNCFLSPLII